MALLRHETAPSGRDGQILVVVVIVLLLLMASMLTSMSVVTHRERDVRHGRNRMLAKLAAQSGVQRQINDIRKARDLASVGSPFDTVDAMDSNENTGIGGFTATYTGAALVDFVGVTVGEYDVLIDVELVADDTRHVTITCQAYVPSKAEYEAGVTDAVRADAHTIAEVAIRGSEVFDYAYFVNHWGWFYGDSIFANGNVRSNGQFDFGGHQATINGSPRYEGSEGTELVGYLDDNNDGVTDGSDGGVYSGMSVVNAQSAQGMGGLPENQHEMQPVIEMPNLSDLTWYEERAIADGTSIEIDGSTYVNGVLGDDGGESQHLFLTGTEDDPIVLDGPVVVRGSVVISGYVTGQGSIYAGGNIYVPSNLEYLDPPATSRPSSNDQATVEAWRAASADKDSLGLFAREHIVVGDYTKSVWQNNVSAWINHPLNKSEEDAGADGIQNTRDGLDGVPGTADDDVLEDDGQWTVSNYTQDDADNGLIPAGFSVGDVIPGSGEDIDGDGVYDGTTQMSEFNIPASLSPSNWAGNLSQSYASYSSVSTLYLSQLDAAFYTNHTLAAVMINWGGDIDINGSIVSRNESIIYGAQSIQMNHDERLTGRGTSNSGFESAVSWDPIQHLQWEFDKTIPQNVVGFPDQIVEHYTGGGGAS